MLDGHVIASTLDLQARYGVRRTDLWPASWLQVGIVFSADGAKASSIQDMVAYLPYVVLI